MKHLDRIGFAAVCLFSAAVLATALFAATVDAPTLSPSPAGRGDFGIRIDVVMTGAPGVRLHAILSNSTGTYSFDSNSSPLVIPVANVTTQITWWGTKGNDSSLVQTDVYETSYLGPPDEPTP